MSPDAVSIRALALNRINRQERNLLPPRHVSDIGTTSDLLWTVTCLKRNTALSHELSITLSEANEGWRTSQHQ